MTLKTSLVIAGDASSAVTALGQTNAGLEQNESQAQATAKAWANADVAITKLAQAQARARQENDASKASYAAGEIQQEQYNRQLLETKSALSLVEAEHRQAINVLRQSKQALDANGVSLGSQRAGYMNLGRQAQDVAVQLQMGANLGTILAQQGPQVADALQMMGGRFAGLASFMAGPWGAAIFLASSVLIDQLVPALWRAATGAAEEEQAMRKVELASDGLGAAQSVLGGMFDLTTGKIKNQTEMLILNARQMAINLRAEALKEQASSKRTMAFDDSKLGLSTGNAVLGALGWDVSADFGRSRGVSNLIARMKAGKISREDALRESEKLDFSGLAITKQDLQQSILDQVSSELKTKTAALIDKSVDQGSLDKGLRRPGAPKNPPKPKVDKGLGEFGEDTASKIAGIKDQFSDLPSAVERANKAMRSLDDIASDIEKRRPPNYSKLVPALAEARTAVQQSLTRPFTEYLEKAQQAVQIDALLAAGMDDQAEALKIVLALKEKMKPLDRDQLAVILETVAAERTRAMVLRDQRALIQANINAVRDMRGALEQTVGDMLKGKFSLSRIITSIGNSTLSIMSQRIVESMFGNTLRKLEARASGQEFVEAAGSAMAKAMDRGTGAVTSHADAVERAMARINAATGLPAASSAPATPENRPADADPVYGDIVVNGRREKAAPLTGPDPIIIAMVDEVLRPLGIKLPKQLIDAVSGMLGKLETGLPQIMKGALTGATTSKLILGSGGSSLGGAVGGALGQKLGEQFLTKGLSSIASSLGGLAGPIGSIAGGLLGGIVGGLFKKTKTGSATVGNVDGEGAVTGTGGNSKSRISAARGLASSGLSALDQIIDQLNGDLGTFSASIGIRNKKYVVDPSGQGKTKGSGVQKFATEEEANAALLADIIKDGAVKGVSAAIQKALQSSSDVQQAVNEALKVQEVELAIGGIGAQLEKAFKDLEKQAQERLRVAKAYGFDVVAIEQKNAQDRLKLTEQLLDQQVGSLQNLITQMTSGSLFEGSAVDQRTALLAEISKVRDAANAGEEGAAEKLSGLLEQLNTVSRDAYGTTGGFAQDRALITDVARETIAAANQRITDAQKATDPALATTNAALDENNDQNAAMLAAQAQANAYLAQIAGGGTVNYSGLAALARTS